TLVLPYYSGKDIEKGTLTGDIKSEIMEIVQTNINPYEDFNTTTRFIQEVHDTREVLSASCSSNREYPFCLTENRKRFWFNYYMTMYYYRVIDSVVLTRYKQAATHQNNIPDEVLSDMVSKDIVMEVLRNNPSKYLKVFFLNFARIYALPMSKEELLAFPHKLAHPLRWFFDNGYSVCFLLAGIVLAAAAAVKKLRFDSVVWFFFFTIFVNNICLNVVISLSHAAEERYWYLFLWMWFVFDFGLIFLLPTALYQKRLRKIGHEYDPDK
ncbi:MAG: hypothetical protein HQK97_00205, partial [Nitrospirae bacterium]|nr:hypothetical protein [Nitrospirota bacterium]